MACSWHRAACGTSCVSHCAMRQMGRRCLGDDAGTRGGPASMIVRATMLGTEQIFEVTEKSTRDLKEQELACGC